MKYILKALVMTSFMALVIGFSFAAIAGLILYSVHANGLGWIIGEGFALVATLGVSSLVFMHAYKYERYGDARRPDDAA